MRWQQNPHRTRIDARTGAEKAYGIRNTHRDTRGNIIGGQMPQPDGSLRPFGNKERAPASPSQPSTPTPRLDAGPQTPRLDSNPLRPPAPRPAPASPSTTPAPAGSALLKNRQDLFDRMRQAGAGGIGPAMEQEARGLGVTPGGLAFAKSKLPQAPASIAADQLPPVALSNPRRRTPQA